MSRPARDSRVYRWIGLGLILLLTSGCIKNNSCACDIPRACCRGLVPQCAACAEGLTLEEWFAKICPEGADDAHYGGWDEKNEKPIWICDDAPREKAVIAD